LGTLRCQGYFRRLPALVPFYRETKFSLQKKLYKKSSIREPTNGLDKE